MRVTWTESGTDGLVMLAVGRPHVLARGWLFSAGNLRVGNWITGNGWRVQLENTVTLPDEDGLWARAWVCKMEGLSATGEEDCVVRQHGLSLGWITLSDKGARGERVDASGPAIRDTAVTQLELSLARGTIIPDEPLLLKAALVDFCLQQGFDLVFTTGGTGVGPRDITPETTLPLLDRRLEGFELAMTQASLIKTPHGMISRAVAGTIGQSVVINLPGSPKAVRENLLAVLPALRHTVEKLQGDTKDCGHVP